jgi:hypothetical protein
VSKGTLAWPPDETVSSCLCWNTNMSLVKVSVGGYGPFHLRAPGMYSAQLGETALNWRTIGDTVFLSVCTHDPWATWQLISGLPLIPPILDALSWFCMLSWFSSTYTTFSIYLLIYIVTPLKHRAQVSNLCVLPTQCYRPIPHGSHNIQYLFPYVPLIVWYSYRRFNVLSETGTEL